MEKIEIIKVIVLAVAGLYETLSRIIPTSKTWSIIGTIVNLIKKISDALDSKKKK